VPFLTCPFVPIFQDWYVTPWRFVATLVSNKQLLMQHLPLLPIFLDANLLIEGLENQQQ
jgi:hypothetical protein